MPDGVSADSTPSRAVQLGEHPGLWLALAAALALKLVILLTGHVTFNSDEAIMSLMARHILQGEHAVFYWGQAYMGTLHSYLMAPIFALLGETVVTSRLVPLAVHLAVVATTYVLAWRVGEDRFGAAAAALLVALPPVMVTLYTTVSIGAWVEILLLNNLIWLVGWGVLAGHRQAAGWWALAGFLVGVGWWELPIIVTSAAPLAALGAWRFRRRMPWGMVATLAVAFLVGATPWIIGLAAAPADLLADAGGVRLRSAFAGDEAVTGWGGRAVSVLLFNLPALFGLRPSWSLEWIALPAGLLVIAFYVLVFWQAARRLGAGRETEYRRIAFGSLLSGWVLILTLLAASPFASDPSGRYIAVLYPPAAILAGEWLGLARRGEVNWLHGAGRWAAPAVLVGVLAYNLAGVARSMAWDPPGLTTQFAPIAHIPHDHDEELIDFLDSLGVDRGYGNFWITFRFAFLTGERIIIAPLLPYKEDMSYDYLDDKYPPYSEMVRRAERVVYVTSNHPALDRAIGERFDALGIRYRVQRIGPYTVFYDLPRNVQPEELGPFGAVTGREIYGP